MRRLASTIAGITGVFGGMAVGWSGVLAQGNQPPAPIRKVDVTVTILEVRSIEAKSAADLFARVTIAGDTSLSRVAAKPSLRVTMPGVTDSTLVPVRLELFEKRPATYDGQIDINQIPGKRDIDFVVDPAACTIKGFAQTYACTDVITRTGRDSKPGEIAFRIDVVR